MMEQNMGGSDIFRYIKEYKNNIKYFSFLLDAYTIWDCKNLYKK